MRVGNVHSQYEGGGGQGVTLSVIQNVGTFMLSRGGGSL